MKIQRQWPRAVMSADNSQATIAKQFRLTLHSVKNHNNHAFAPDYNKQLLIDDSRHKFSDFLKTGQRPSLLTQVSQHKIWRQYSNISSHTIREYYFQHEMGNSLNQWLLYCINNNIAILISILPSFERDSLPILHFLTKYTSFKNLKRVNNGIWLFFILSTALRRL